ncbi:MAG: SHOCT domain-containing protein [Pseudomonadota bacterium]
MHKPQCAARRLIRFVRTRGAFTAPFLLIVTVALLAIPNAKTYARDSVQMVWEKNKNVYVRLAPATNGPLDHPAQIDVGALKFFLQNLYLRDEKSKDSSTNRSENEPQAALTEDQIAVLLEHVPSAFDQADPQQVVEFVVDRTISSLGGLRNRQTYTAGTLFVAGKKLSVLIGDHDRERNYGYEAAYDPTSRGLVAYDFDHGRPSEKKPALKEQLVLGATGDLGRVRALNWVEADPALLSERANESVAEARVAAANAQSGYVSRREVEELIRASEEKRAVVAAPGATTAAVSTGSDQAAGNAVGGVASGSAGAATTAAAVSSSGTKSSTSSSPRLSLEERFELLERLKGKGLLTEDEYEAKRRELLSEI